MGKMYGNLMNRLAEGKQYVDEITVGTGVTEYFWSDRKAYEVVEVIDQKHISIREYDAKPVGEAMSNEWELVSNSEKPVIKLVKRGGGWYTVSVATAEDLERLNKARENRNDVDFQLWWVHNGFEADKVLKNGCQRKYHKRNISIGTASYYYDYSF